MLENSEVRETLKKCCVTGREKFGVMEVFSSFNWE